MMHFACNMIKQYLHGEIHIQIKRLKDKVVIEYDWKRFIYKL